MAKAKKRKLWKKLLIGFGIFFLVLLGAIIAIPYFFKGELLELAKTEINKNVDAKVDFKDVNLSLIKSFPDFTFSLEELDIAGVERFEGVPLAKMERLDLTLDLMSVINGDKVEIKKVGLVKPDINVMVTRDGAANYDIAKPTDASTSEEETSGEATSFEVGLNEYYITDGRLVYDDKPGGTYLKIEGLNHSGSGNFTEAIYDIATRTKIDKLTAVSGGVGYLNKANLDADLTVNADMNSNTFTLKENSIRLNALKINADGQVAMKGNDVNVDLKFDAPSSEFKHLLSMIPGAYTKDFEGVKADGTFKFNGFAKGTYNEKRLPAFGLDLNIGNGSFQYPDLPMGMKDIKTNIKVNSPSSDLDKMTVDIPSFHMLLGANPFDATLNLKTPISDPDVDSKVKGKIDLADLAKAFPMEGVQSLKGIINADVATKTKMSYIDNEQYDKVDMAGALQVQGVDYVADGMPKVSISNMEMDFTPQNVNLKDFTAILGKSDIKANGTLDNILAYFAPDKTMKGTLKLRSKFFDANEWMGEEETASPQPATGENPAETPEGESEIFDRFDFTLDAEMNEIAYDDLKIMNTVAKGHFTPSTVEFSEMSTKVGKSDIAMKGKLTNVFPFVFDNETLGGEIDITSNTLDLNELMGYTGSTEDAAPTEKVETPEPAGEGEAILIPDNFNIKLNTDIKKVIYTNMNLNSLKGAVIVADSKASLADVTAKTLGGTIKLAGGYDSSDKENPLFDITYSMLKMDFEESFKTLNTFQKLAPVGEFLKGTFSTDIKISGKLGKDMMPDMNTISASGLLETINAVVDNFEPIQAIGNKLNVKYLKDDISIKNTKNWFEVVDGRVKVKPFDAQVKDVKMKIGGSHGFDQSLDYVVDMIIPKDLIAKGKVGDLADTGLDFLNQHASKFGVNLNSAGSEIHVKLRLTGPMKKPDVKVEKVSLGGEKSVKDAATDAIKDVANQVADSVKTIVEDKVDEVTEQVKDVVDDKVEEVTEQVKGVVDDKMEEVKDQVKDQVGDVVGDKVEDVKDQVGEQVGDKIDDALDGKLDDVKDKVKDGIGGWNPFKKDKKDDD